MKSKLNALAGFVALLTIAIFRSATIASEAFGTISQIILVKQTILKAMFLLIPALAITGGSGFALGGKWKSPLVLAKKTRMKIVALNGL